jgi:ABC-2 type transport system ATP-binding protein
MAKTIAELVSVTKSYGGHVVLRDVSLHVTGGVTGLLGPNGSGKSTLIKALLGLVRIDGGTGRVLNLDWPRQTRELRDRVGFLPEDDCFIYGLQGIQSIQMMARLSGLQRLEALRRAHEVADFCDLGQERYRTVETYSTGMRQKLKFAQALVHDPELIILDEPTTGLDPAQRESFLDRINILAREKGKSIIVSTHILHDVQRVCDDVIILVNGQVRLIDSLANLQKPSQSSMTVNVVAGAPQLHEALSALGLNATLDSSQEITVFGDHISVEKIWLAGHQSQVMIKRIEPAKNSLEKLFLEAVQGA